MSHYTVGDRIDLDRITDKATPANSDGIVALHYIDRTALHWLYSIHDLDLLSAEAMHNIRGDDVYPSSIPSWREDRVRVTISQVLTTFGDTTHYLLEGWRPGAKVPFLTLPSRRDGGVRDTTIPRITSGGLSRLEPELLQRTTTASIHNALQRGRRLPTAASMP